MGLSYLQPLTFKLHAISDFLRDYWGDLPPPSGLATENPAIADGKFSELDITRQLAREPLKALAC